MGWDCEYFVPKNNIFRKNEKKPEHDDQKTRLVTEVNRVIVCSDCGKRVGDVASIFHEVNGRYYCAKCGSKKPLKQ